MILAKPFLFFFYTISFAVPDFSVRILDVSTGTIVLSWFQGAKVVGAVAWF